VKRDDEKFVTYTDQRAQCIEGDRSQVLSVREGSYQHGIGENIKIGSISMNL
jgi:hypothetical protein